MRPISIVLRGALVVIIALLLASAGITLIGYMLITGVCLIFGGAWTSFMFGVFLVLSALGMLVGTPVLLASTYAEKFYDHLLSFVTTGSFR